MGTSMNHMTDISTPAPAGSQQLTTFLAVPDCAKAIDFYVACFGAVLTSRFDGPNGMVAHAELRFGDSLLQLGDPAPDNGIVGPPATGNCYTLTFWTSSVDETFARALAMGATELTPVSDSFTGDRMGILRCPFGVRWCIARHDRDVPEEEIAAIAATWG
jgi:PhnB protein